MIRAVVDTNALASGFVNRAGPSGRILQRWRDDSPRRFLAVLLQQGEAAKPN